MRGVAIVDKSTDHDKSLFDLFLPGMNVEENVFFLQCVEALCDTSMRAAWYELLSTMANCGKI